MTALAADRPSATQYGSADEVIPKLISLPMAAATIIYAGAMVASDASGNAVPGTASTALKIWGRAEVQVDNTAGSAGDKRINVKPGVFAMNNSSSTDLIAAKNVGQPAYLVDDNTVALTDGNGSRPIAGLIFPFDPSKTTVVEVGIGPGFAATYPASGGSSAFKARGVVFANVASLAAFAVASNDGITYVAGDVVLLAAQTTASQNGPYVVGTVAGGNAALTRPSWWATGAAIIPGQVIQLGGEGTIFGGSEWKALCAKSKIVDTDDPVFYPRTCKGTTAAFNGSTGVITLGSAQGLFLKSTTASSVVVTRNTAGTPSGTTGGYASPVASRVAGVSGTAVVTIVAQAAAGTTNTADTSTVDFLICNW
jgi:hypothetical protein